MRTWLRVHRLALADAARRPAAQPLASLLAIAVIALDDGGEENRAAVRLC